MLLVTPERSPPPGGSMNRRLLAEAAAARGGHLELEADHGYVGRYTPPGGHPRPIFGKSLGLNRDSAAGLAGDKDYTARWLTAAGLPAPAGQVIFSPRHCAERALKNARVAGRLPGAEAARAFAERHGYPVVVKPNRGEEGRGISVAHTPEDLARDIELGFAREDQLRIEPRIEGRDHRLLVLEDRVILAYERRPFSLVGDGTRTVAALLDRALADLAGKHQGRKLLPDDPRLGRRLAAEGLTPQSVLPEGATVALLDNANLSTGGQLRDLTGQLPRAAEDLAVAATRSLGLTFAGVDILSPDLGRGPEGAVILEVNAGPSFDHYAAESPAHFERARAAVVEIFARLERQT
ncbi:hypothetical protein [Tropicimonas marinistellae]|uniref:ATP-binding protein n=1 Tax=Tropicimonas marinistellae TaxID=1739787 RepID=UPI00082C0BEF|nr:hypothetical protein [Tropicimonas marinistellae]